MALRLNLFLLIVCLPLPCFAQGGAVLGLDVPLTGSASDIGHYLLWGVEIAIDEANMEGGALGKPIRLVVLDDEMDPARAAANITRFVEKDRVSAVLGPANSGNALAFIPLLQRAKIPNMLLTASATKLTRIYENETKNFIFRATLPDREQIQALINWTAARYKKIAIACDTSTYAQLGKEDLLETMRVCGLEPLTIVEFDPGELDMTSQARQLQASPAEAVVVISLGQEVANLVRSADAIGYHPQFVGQYPFFLHPVKELPNRLSNGLIGVLSSTPEDSGKAREIDTIIRSKYLPQGYYPFKFVEAAYEGAKLTIQAIREAGSADGEAIRDALENTAHFEGVSRVFVKPFDKTRHELYKADNLFMGSWKDGQVYFLDK